MLDKYVNYLWPLFYATQAVYASSVASITVLPFFYSMATGIPYYSIPLFFPLVDEMSNLGFVITYLFLFIGSYFWVPTLIASDVLYFSQLILAAGHLQTINRLLDTVDERVLEREAVAEEEQRKKLEQNITKLLHRVCFEHQQHLV